MTDLREDAEAEEMIQDRRRTREIGELVMALRAMGTPGDPERDHSYADHLLLRFIDDPKVTAAYDAIKKWYA